MAFFSGLSLRKRLIIASTIWVALGSFVGYWLLSSAFHNHVSKQFYHELIQHIDELRNITDISDSGSLFLVSEFSDAKYNDQNSGYYWEVYTENSTLRSPSLNGVSLELDKEPIQREISLHKHTILGDNGPILVIEKSTHISPLNTVPKRIIIAVDKRHLDDMIGDFNIILLWALFVFAVSMVLAATLLTNYALHPFRILAKEFIKIRSGETKTIDGEYPQEVTPLVTELNNLVQTSDDMLKRARAQAGNLAHGLKGSLAIVTDEGYKLEDDGFGQSSKVIIKQCAIMQRHIDHHIARARASAAARLPGTISNIEAVLLPIVKAMKQLNKDKNIEVNVDMRTQKRVAVDSVDLSEILGNIIDNAFKVAQSRIGIIVQDCKNAQISICFDDDGPGLPPEAHDVVFDLGERWDETTPGGGLGLAIVRELVHLYGGNCQLDTSPEDGLRVEIFLPAVQD